MMDYLFLLIFLLSAIFVAVAVFVLNKKIKELLLGRNKDQSLMLLQNQIENLTKTLDARLNETNKLSNDSSRQQFSEFTRLSQEVTAQLVKLEETNKQVIDFADQLQSLQDILKNPKQRGVLGEYYLETVLKNVLPPDTYKMQYKFADNEIVDAVVFVQEKIIPIDSKFSLENYNRVVEEKNPVEREKLEKIFVNDLKQRVTETAKYIRPKENTMDFAFMFIPHEAIYYDLLINKIGTITEDTESVIERAARKYHVIIVSPTSFLAYLQTVLQGLRALKIEESAKEIRKNIDQLSRHLLNYQVYLDKLGNNLSTTVNTYNTAAKEFKKIDKDVARITGGEGRVEVLELDKPATE